MEQLDILDAIEAGEAGKRASVDAVSEATRAAFARILNEHLTGGRQFSADDLRDQLDLAQVPNRARGGLMSGALARGVMREVGVHRSTHPATHGKRISVYVAVDPARFLLD